MKVKRLLCILLVLAMVFALAACGSLTTGGNDTPASTQTDNPQPDNTPSTDTPNQGNEPSSDDDGPITLVAAVTSDCGGLSPYGINRGGKQATRSATYEALFWLDADKNLCPILAKDYEDKGDGTYVVTLFDYITDSAGNKMTASDIVYSIGLMIEEGHGGSYIGSLSDYKALSDYEVELHFADENAGNFETLVTNLYCVTQAAWEASPDQMATSPVGTGLYVYTGGTAGSEYNFEARDNYWQTDAKYLCDKNTANVDKFTLKVITDASTIAVALETGEIDYTQNIEEADRANFINDDGTVKDGYIAKRLLNGGLIRLIFNCGENSPFQDIYLRKALATCIDNAALAYSAKGPFGNPCTNLINPSWLDAKEELNALDDYYNYDLDAAKELLKKSSYDGETLRLLVQPNENCTNSSVLIQSYAKAIGIDIELLEYESAMANDLYMDETGTQWDFVCWGLSSTYSHTWKALYELDINQHKTDTNYMMIADQKLQSLYETAASSATNSPEAVDELIDYVTDQCYEYGLYYYSECYVGGDRVQSISTGAGNAESIYCAFVLTP